MYDHESFLHCIDRVKSGLMLDIGANVGKYTSLMLEAGASSVWAIEAGSANCQQLIERFGNDHRVRVIHAAVGVDNGTTELYLHSTGTEGHTINKDKAESGAFGHDLSHVESVPAASLDQLVSGYESQISFIKCDVEGAEQWVLEGGRRFLQTYSPLLSIEIHQKVDIAAIDQLLRELGYTITLDGVNPVERMEIFIPGHAYICFKEGSNVS